MKSINWLGVVLATIINFAVGAGWYGYLFAVRWTELRLGGVEPTPESMNASYWQGPLLGLFQSFGLAWLIAMLGRNSFFGGAWTGIFVSFFFSSAILFQDVIYAHGPVELFSINAGYVLIWMTLAGAVIGGLRLPAKKA